MYEFCIRGYCFQKLLLVLNFSFINENDYFIKETDTIGYSDIWTIYTFHTDHFTPKHTDLSTQQHAYQSLFELLPGLSPFAIFWDAGWTLEKDVYINMNYNYPTTIWESIFAQMYKFLVEKNVFFQFLLINFSRSKAKIVNNTWVAYIWAKILPHTVVG